jgi:hypothetical protein
MQEMSGIKPCFLLGQGKQSASHENEPSARRFGRSWKLKVSEVDNWVLEVGTDGHRDQA